MSRFAVTIGLALGLMILAPGDAAGNHCQAQVIEYLDLLKVEPSDIRGIMYVAALGGERSDDRREARDMAWVELRSCQGSVIVGMTRSGRVHQVFGRGDCDLGGAIKTW
jgi:hypothetical protein